MLKYIKNARDADEHGLRRITERTPQSVGVNFHPDTIISGFIKGNASGVQMSFETPPSEIRIIPSAVKLVEVVNHGARYLPPDVHRGEPIPRIHPVAHPHPLTVAELTLVHLDALIAEAAGLVK